MALGGRTSQLAALLVVPQIRQAASEVHQLAGLVVYAPPSTRQARTSQTAALVPYEIGKFTVPRTSQLALLVVYTTGVPDQSRSRAWSFVLDGHTMYVLNLGEEGTFVYDTVTQQWCKFETWGYNQWNVIAELSAVILFRLRCGKSIRQPFSMTAGAILNISSRAASRHVRASMSVVNRCASRHLLVNWIR
jgi:hypothetical protein